MEKEMEILGRPKFSSTLVKAVGQKNEAVAQVELVRHGDGIFLINGEHARAYLQNDLNSLINIKDTFEVLLSVELDDRPRVRVGWAKGGFVIIEKKKKRKKKSVPLSEPVVASLPVNPAEEGTEFQTDPSSIFIIDDGSLIIKVGSLNLSVTSLNLSVTSLMKNNGFLIRKDKSLRIAPGEVAANMKDDRYDCPLMNGINIIVTVEGGDLIDQVDAIKLGLARAFCIYENEGFGLDDLRPIYEEKGYLIDSKFSGVKKPL